MIDSRFLRKTPVNGWSPTGRIGGVKVVWTAVKDQLVGIVIHETAREIIEDRLRGMMKEEAIKEGWNQVEATVTERDDIRSIADFRKEVNDRVYGR